MATFEVGTCRICGARLLYQRDPEDGSRMVICRECMPPEQQQSLQEDFDALPAAQRTIVAHITRPRPASQAQPEKARAFFTTLDTSAADAATQYQHYATAVVQGHMTHEEAIHLGIETYRRALAALGETPSTQQATAFVIPILATLIARAFQHEEENTDA